MNQRQFSNEEALEIAIKIEENGRNFYLKAFEKEEKQGLKDLLKKLSDEELKHKN